MPAAAVRYPAATPAGLIKRSCARVSGYAYILKDEGADKKVVKAGKRIEGA